jgi:rubrerythrin
MASPEETHSAPSSARSAFETAGHGPFAGVDHVSLDRPETSDEHVLALVEAHIKAESEDLGIYRNLATSPDPVTAGLMQMVIEDEERHHDLLKRLAVRLQDDLSWESSPDALPADNGSKPRIRGNADSLRELARHEHQGARHLEVLAREARELQRPLATLLLYSMALDSQKHELILGYIGNRLERSH